MKIACLTVLVASAMSASAAPFSFAGLTGQDDPGTPTTLPSFCVAEEDAFGACAAKNMADKLDGIEPCLTGCLVIHDEVDCAMACGVVNKCFDKCVSECKTEAVANLNCELKNELGEGVCSCAAERAYLSSIENFAANLAGALKAKNNLRA